MASKGVKWIKYVIILILSFESFSKVQGIDGQRLPDPVSKWISNMFESEPHKYSKLISPAINEKDPLLVNLSLNINNVHNMDEVTGTLTLIGRLEITWTDRRLVWNPDSSGLTNKSVIDIPSYYCWTPDIELENHVDIFSTVSNDISKSNKIALHSNGKLEWTFPVTLKASCPIDHRNYPFDEYVCELRLVSENHEHSKIILHKMTNHYRHGAHGDVREVSKRNINSNPAWTVTKQKSEIVHYQKRKHDGHHSVYQYTLHLRRHSPGQKFIILMPIILAMGMTLSVFWLPPANGQRITVGGITVLIFLTMLMYVGWKIPSGGRHIPSVVIFCGVSLLLAGMSIIISVIVMQLSTFSIYRPMPRILKSFLDHRRIRQLFCINFPNRQMDDDGMRLVRNVTDATTEAQAPNIISETDPNEPVLTDWKLMAYVTDRASFITYSFVFVILLFTFSM